MSSSINRLHAWMLNKAHLKFLFRSPPPRWMRGARRYPRQLRNHLPSTGKKGAKCWNKASQLPCTALTRAIKRMRVLKKVSRTRRSPHSSTRQCSTDNALNATTRRPPRHLYCTKPRPKHAFPRPPLLSVCSTCLPFSSPLSPSPSRPDWSTSDASPTDQRTTRGSDHGLPPRVFAPSRKMNGKLLLSPLTHQRWVRREPTDHHTHTQTQRNGPDRSRVVCSNTLSSPAGSKGTYMGETLLYFRS